MRLENETITLESRELKVLLAWASKDRSRTYICSVAFDPTYGAAVSTDGNRLLMLRPTDPNGPMGGGVAYPVSRDAMEQALRVTGPRGTVAVTVRDAPTPTGARVASIDATPAGGQPVHMSSPIVGAYPPYRQVIPARLAGCSEPVAFDLELLGAVRELGKACCCKGGKVYLSGPLDPALVVATGAECEATGVLMPMRL